MSEQGSAAGDRNPEPAAYGFAAVDRFVLENGLEVWHRERPGSGTVSLIMVVRAGARHETRYNNGISHFLEHMLFDGSERWDEFEIKDVIRRHGGYYNAQTDYEYTAYEAHLLARDLEIAVDWLAELIFRPELDPEKVARERQVLFQEKGGRSSRAVDLLESWGLGYDLGLAVRRRLFPDSSLGFRVAGEDVSLDRIDREMLAAYHRLHYRPNNMALIVVGDVSLERARRAAEKYLGEFAAAAVPPPLEPAPAPPGMISVMLKGPNLADRSAMRRGARTVGAGHRDAVVLEMVAEILSNRLIDEVRMRQGLVYSIGAYNVGMSDVGYFVVRTESDAAHMGSIMQTVEEHLGRLRDEVVAEDELRQAKASLMGQFALTTQSNASLAWLFASYATWCRAGARLPDYCQAVEGVTAAEIARVARQYFMPENGYVGLYRPAVTLKTGALGVAAGLALAVGMMLWQHWQRPANEVV